MRFWWGYEVGGGNRLLKLKEGQRDKEARSQKLSVLVPGWSLDTDLEGPPMTSKSEFLLSQIGKLGSGRACHSLMLPFGVFLICSFCVQRSIDRKS